MPRSRAPQLSHAETMKQVQAACDELIELVTRGHRPPVTCRAGCAYCCQQPVFITPLEGVAIAEYVRAHGFEAEAARRTAIYLDEIGRRRAGRQGLSALRASVNGIGPPPTTRQRRAVYGVDCPFLEHGRCAIYPARPLMCREHISFDDVARCKRDEPFVGLDKPRFSEVPAFFSMGAVAPKNRMRPVYEYLAAEADASRTALVTPGALRRALRWKTGR